MIKLLKLITAVIVIYAGLAVVWFGWATDIPILVVAGIVLAVNGVWIGVLK